MSNYRRIMEGIIGRKLESHEHVHHKDRNRSNNDPSNLELCPTPKDHYREHAWDQEELIRWLIQYADEFGHLPTQRECDAHPGMPHSSTFRRHFGSWSMAIRAAQNRIDEINHFWEEEVYDDEGDGYITPCNGHPNE